MKTHIITHHSNGATSNKYASTQHHSVATINNWHKRRWPRFISKLGFHVGYHYVILPDGKIEQTRLDSEEGAHTYGMNRVGIGVLFVGNKTKGAKDKDTPEMEAAWKKLAPELMAKHHIPESRIHPHRRYAKYKDCHGDSLTDDHYIKLLHEVEVDPTEKKIKALEEQVFSLRKLIESLIAGLIAALTEHRAKALGEVSIRSSYREQLREVDGKTLGNYKLDD